MLNARTVGHTTQYLQFNPFQLRFFTSIRQRYCCNQSIKLRMEQVSEFIIIGPENHMRMDRKQVQLDSKTFMSYASVRHILSRLRENLKWFPGGKCWSRQMWTNWFPERIYRMIIRHSKLHKNLMAKNLHTCLVALTSATMRSLGCSKKLGAASSAGLYGVYWIC